MRVNYVSAENVDIVTQSENAIELNKTGSVNFLYNFIFFLQFSFHLHGKYLAKFLTMIDVMWRVIR